MIDFVKQVEEHYYEEHRRWRPPIRKVGFLHTANDYTFINATFRHSTKLQEFMYINILKSAFEKRLKKFQSTTYPLSRF